MNPNNPGRNLSLFMHKCLTVLAIVAGASILFWFVWTTGAALLLLFSAFLVAVALDGLARALARVSRLSRRLAVVAVIVIFALLIGLTTTFSTISISSKAPELGNKIEQAVDALQDKLQQYPFSAHLFSNDSENTPSAGTSGSNSGIGASVARNLSGAVTVTLTSLIDLFIVLVIGLYLALSPELYYEGLLRLFPPASRGRVELIAHEATDAVRRWLLGRALAMVLVGLGSIAGLWLLDVPFPILLGTLAGLLTFIPYLGAIISAIPALLIAGLDGLWPMLYVVLLYLGLHAVEAYLLTPLIQRRTASFAPAFLLSVQVLGGAVAGVIGVALAAPIALICTVIVQLGYVQNMMGEKPHLPSDSRTDK